MLDPSNIPSGTIIGDYQVESYIGRGNNAAVYRAIQLSLNRIVALKVLFLTTADEDHNFINIFFNEVRSAAALSHINLVKAIEVGTFQNVFYFAMEYVDGQSLQKLLDNDQLPDLGLIVKIMAEIASSLQYGLTKQKLTHGDIKPDNILLSSNATPKLADFGLAKTRENCHVNSDELFVTPLYASPEAVQGHTKYADPLPDIYSFGCTLFHLIAKRPPFIGDDPQEICECQAFEEPPAIESIVPNLPLELASLINSMLKKDPKKRPQSWKEISQRLFSLLDGYSDYKSDKRKFTLDKPKKKKTSSKRNRKKSSNALSIFITIFVVAFASAAFAIYKINDIKSYFDYRQIINNLPNSTPRTNVERLKYHIMIYGPDVNPEAYKLLKRYEKVIEEEKKEN
ncbi:MAG: serine/threonine protein kinase [Lentisphaeria bacterium]